MECGGRAGRRLVLVVVGLVLTGLCAASALRRTAGAVDPSTLDVVSVSTAANLVTVAKVTASTCRGVEVGSGFVTRAGFVITAAHVVDGADRATVTIGGRGPMAARVVGVDRTGRDIAVLSVPELAAAEGIAGAQVSTRSLERGTDIAAAGHALGGPNQTLAGKVIGYVDDGPVAADGARVLTVSIPFEPGMSGGPVVDTRGRVVGVVIGVERNTGTGIAVPAAMIVDAFDGERLGVALPCGAGG